MSGFHSRHNLPPFRLHYAADAAWTPTAKNNRTARVRQETVARCCSTIMRLPAVRDGAGWERCPMGDGSERPVRLLLLWGDLYGANCTSNTRKRSILEQFLRYGWELTSVGVGLTVGPCAFARQRGAEPSMLDCTVDEIPDVVDFDGISIMPGPTHQGLIHSPKAITLIQQAADAGLVLSAWCRGVRVLAAADVLQGKRVVGHADDKDILEKAGAIYVGHDHLPVIDGRLVTGARSYHYRAENAEAIRKAMTDRVISLAG